MKRSILSILAATMLSLPFATSSFAGNGTERGGGDSLAAEFITTGRLILKELQGAEKEGSIKVPFKTSALADALSANVSSTNDSIYLHGDLKEAWNDPDKRKIAFSRQAWMEMSEYRKFKLVLHEYLGIMRSPSDSKFQVSDPLIDAVFTPKKRYLIALANLRYKVAFLSALAKKTIYDKGMLCYELRHVDKLLVQLAFGKPSGLFPDDPKRELQFAEVAYFRSVALGFAYCFASGVIKKNSISQLRRELAHIDQTIKNITEVLGEKDLYKYKYSESDAADLFSEI